MIDAYKSAYYCVGRVPLALHTGETMGDKIAASDVSFFYPGTDQSGFLPKKIEHQALHNISLGIPEHEITAIIGPSGCGKSTLLRTFNRIYELYPGQRVEGDILLDGATIFSPQYADFGLTLLRKRVGMVFQKPTPFPMSIYNNIAFGIRLHEQLPVREMDIRVEQALRQAALWHEVKDKLKQSGYSLSGGQQQRLCIARTIAVQPEVLLLDEPCSSLDPGSTDKIETLLLQLKSTHTIVIVTHNLGQAGRISDHVAFLLYGKLEEWGGADEMINRPKKKTTEEFIEGRFG